MREEGKGAHYMRKKHVIYIVDPTPDADGDGGNLTEWWTTKNERAASECMDRLIACGLFPFSFAWPVPPNERPNLMAVK